MKDSMHFAGRKT